MLKDQAKVELSTRFIAAVIDGVMGWVVGFVPLIGAVIGALYMLLKDGLFEGQSLGKKVMKLQVVTQDGKKADFSDSAKRNVIFAIPLIIMIIPILGWIIAPILGIIVLVVEVMKIMGDPQGRRIGDNFADTQVINFIEVAETKES